MVSKRKGSPHIKKEIRKSLNITTIKSYRSSGKPIKDITFKLFFEKDNNDNFTTDALLYQDIIRYYFEISKKEDQGSNTFKIRELQRWLIDNNLEFKRYYSGSNAKITIKNRINSINDQIPSKSKQIENRKGRIRRIFDNLILLNLINKKGEASMEKFASHTEHSKTYLYAFTTSGELIALLIKSYNLENENHPNNAQIVELSKIYKKIFRLVEFIFDYAENNKSSYLFEYYKKFFQSIFEKNYQSKTVTYLINICETRNINSVEYLLENLLLIEFLPYYKNDRRIFFEIWNRAIESIDIETKNIILYRQKMFIEREFLLRIKKKTKEIEKAQFENRNTYDKIALQGFCNNCNDPNIIIWYIYEYKKMLIENNDGIRFDCKKCISENSCIIPPF